MAAPKIDWTISLGNLLSMITIMGSIMGLYISLVTDVSEMKIRTETLKQLQAQIINVGADVAQTQRDVAVIKDRMEYKR